jgi:hypothetical protein
MHIRQKPLATEAEWLACWEAGRMLEYVWQRDRVARPRACRRQLRLFACACCRRAWHLLPEGPLWDALQTCERYAEGLIDSAQRRAVRAQAHEEANREGPLPVMMAARSIWCAAAGSALAAATGAQSYAANALLHEALQKAGPFATAAESRAVAGRTIGAEWRRHSLLVREVFGNPFRPAAVDPAWLAWNGGVVVRLARAAYEERRLLTGLLDNARLAVLADALEEAGCADGQILGHLRDGGEHVRGCFLVDCLLGKG